MLVPDFQDDGEREGLSIAVRQSLRYFQALPANRPFSFGPDAYSAGEMAEGLEVFLELLGQARPDFADRVRAEFTVYRSTGAPPDGAVVFSSYYEHDLKASLTRTDRYRYPLYARPLDLEERVDVRGQKWAGRTVGGLWGTYFTRKEIDSEGALEGRGLEIAWADNPVDVLFLQVQGSGWLNLPDGSRQRVRYAGNNGHPYRSVGLNLIESGLIPRAVFTRAAMVDYLKTHPRERPSLLNVNPRYVFFKIDLSDSRDQAFGSLNVPVTPRRSIATDPAVFPPGALAWMETGAKNRTARFVLNQDEGGAIKGSARVDYFVGGGAEAESYAVGFWEKGKLYFLAHRRRGAASAGAP